MKLKQIEGYLSKIQPFEIPKIQFEQYPTSAHIASHMMYTAQEVYDDLEGQDIIDLGIGCGMLTVASGLFETSSNTGVDIDPDALEQTRMNCQEFELDVDLIRGNVDDLVWTVPSERHPGKLDWEHRIKLKADTIIMNPPFGTKTQKGIDLTFLKAASIMTEHAVYSLHKTSTREHVLKKASEWGLKGEVVAELHYDLPQTYKFHKRKSVEIQVDFLRFEKVDP
jgi:predicted RNA methylase